MRMLLAIPFQSQLAPTPPLALHGTITGVCAFSPSLSFSPPPNNPAHVSAHSVSPFVFHVVFRHSSEAPPPLHPFCCLVALLLFLRPIVLFVFSFLFFCSFGLFSLTCPCMQQSDFREAPDWDVGESRPSDLYHSSSNTSTIDAGANVELDRSYKSYQLEEKDSYASEVCTH